MFTSRAITWTLALGTALVVSRFREKQSTEAGMHAPSRIMSASTVTTTPTHEPAGSFALVELFTSEGCSSCPPADQVLGELAAEARTSGRRIIPISFHVDYWNRLGWKDPYSNAQYSRRQGEYSRAFGLKSIYTPQMVLNGTEQFVGSDRDHARASIEAALEREPRASVTVHAGAGKEPNTFDVGYEIAGTLADDAVLNVALVERGVVTKVGRGENGGRTLRHENVVRAFQTVHPAGREGHVTIPVTGVSDSHNASVVAYLQSQKTMEIYGATMVDPEIAE